jgi:hypothetical protein
MTSARPLKIGNRVVIKMVGSKYRGLPGTVVWISTTKAGLTSYTVQLDGSTKQLDYQWLDLRLLT